MKQRLPVVGLALVVFCSGLVARSSAQDGGPGPAGGPPVPEAAVDGASVAESSAPEGPTVDGAVAESPAAESPAAESPAAESPAAESPAAERPAAESPTGPAPGPAAPPNPWDYLEGGGAPAPGGAQAPASAPPAAGANPWDYLEGGGAAPAPAAEGGAGPAQGAPSGDDPWAYLSGGGDAGADAGGGVDLAALGLGGGGIELPTYPEMRLYGFVDFSFIYPFTDKDNAWSFLFTDTATFAVGNLNLYIDSKMSESLRSLVEIRFTYLPNGQARQGLPTVDSTGIPLFLDRVDTSVRDYADGERAFRYGAVEIERAWLEYAAYPWLRLRLGQWLTPYGLWNVDHGSPTTISTVRPYIIGEMLFPERQTGLQVQGDYTLGWTRYGYHLGVSNGRGPMDAFLDLDTNKALTGRVFLEVRDTFGMISAGFSGYTGRFTDLRNRVLFGKGGLYNDPLLNYQYDERVLGVDFKLEWGSFLVVYELISHMREYTEKGRYRLNSTLADPSDLSTASLQVVLHPPPPAGDWMPDIHRRGMYFVVGYRFEFLGIMPYLDCEYYYRAERTMPQVYNLQMGINMRPHESVTVKAVFGTGIFVGADPVGPGRDAIQRLEVQSAWAF